MVMSTLKMAALLGVAGVFGVVISVLLGKTIEVQYLIDGALVCFALAGLLTMLHVLRGLWTDFARSA
jgi:hypothetical protein